MQIEHLSLHGIFPHLLLIIFTLMISQQTTYMQICAVVILFWTKKNINKRFGHKGHVLRCAVHRRGNKSEGGNTLVGGVTKGLVKPLFMVYSNPPSRLFKGSEVKKPFPPLFFEAAEKWLSAAILSKNAKAMHTFLPALSHFPKCFMRLLVKCHDQILPI